MNSEESNFKIFNLDPDPEIRKLLDAISGKLGNPGLPLPEHIPLREKKELRIEMIHATMQLEGVGTSLEITTKIINRMNVRGLQNRISDILNIKSLQPVKNLQSDVRYIPGFCTYYYDGWQNGGCRHNQR